ncbi:MAG: hypothetical protein VB949_13710 [Pseudomonadales bacterium]
MLVKTKTVVTLLGLVFATFISTQASATLIVTGAPDEGGFLPYDPTPVVHGDVLYIDWENGTEITFTEDGLFNTPGLDVDTSGSWWNPVTPVYTSHFPPTWQIKISFAGAPVYGFAFNIGADVDTWANVAAKDTGGTMYGPKPDFTVGPTNSPRWGVFQGSNDRCTAISEILIDPPQEIN